MLIIKYILKNVYRKFSTNSTIEMKYLNVAEKNDAAKTIAGFLSNGSARRREGLSVYNKIYEFETDVKGQKCKMVMTSVSGHLLNYEFLPSYRGWRNCEPQQLFEAPVRKSCIENGDKIKKTLEREIRSCQGLILWTDCDREGENIAFEILEVCRAIKPNINVYRTKFSEITGASVRRALANLTQADRRQSEAVDVRQELDLRIGAAFTRFQTLRLQRIFPSQIADKLISYGSCQFPTLGFVAQRYKEAEDFVSEPFWKIKVTHTIEELTVEFHWERNRLFDKEACEDYFMLCLSEPIANVITVTTKPKNKWRPNPMDTVELEKLGSRKLKINAKQTMSIAEKLYTQGFISYPRTETNSFSPDVDLRSLVELHTSHNDWGGFASRVLEWGPNPRNGKKSDQAHPPIHPIKAAPGLTGNEQRVYELIVRHFLACVSKDATGSETVVNITVAGEKFHATGLVIFERNYLDVYPYEKWNGKQIHNYEAGTTFEPTEILMEEGATTAPPLLTEADLIALMEKHGIGTDATHAEHIHTIKERGYIGEVDRGFLVPGTIGMGLYEGYDAMELPLAQPQLRAEFEIDLKKICSGERNPSDVLREQIQKYKEAYRTITQKATSLDEKLARRLNETPQESAPEENPQNTIEEIMKCPKCNFKMILRQKKDNSSYFISCASFPDCKNAVWLPDCVKEIKVTNNNCERCGPDYRKVDIKFKTVNYLALLGSDSNIYTTCLSCDTNFHNIFGINADSVRRIGRIVGDSNSTVTRPAIRNTINRINQESNNQMNNIQNNSVRNNPVVQNRNSNMNSNRNESNNSTRNQINSIPANQIGNSNTNNSLNDLFDDDSMDDLLISTEIETNNYAIQSNNINRNESIRNQRPNNNYVQRSGPPPAPSNGNSSSNNSTQNNSNSQNDEIVRCSVCNEVARNLLVKRDGPNKGRRFYSCPNSSCGFFQWADGNPSNSYSGSNTSNENNPSRNTTSRNGPGTTSSSVRSSSNALVKCNCQESAKSLIVKRDGPNKGRTFYVCSNQAQSCGFFQWETENIPPNSNNQNQPSTSTNYRPTGNGNNNNNNSRQQESSKKRKCGLCRQEGHTKLKCPRKDEFENY